MSQARNPHEASKKQRVLFFDLEDGGNMIFRNGG
jgi:hypothetical protein